MLEESWPQLAEYGERMIRAGAEPALEKLGLTSPALLPQQTFRARNPFASPLPPNKLNTNPPTGPSPRAGRAQRAPPCARAAREPPAERRASAVHPARFLRPVEARKGRLES